MKRGRPPVTRARVLNYIEKHHPETVMQVARALHIDRAQLYRILHAAYGPHFRDKWKEQPQPSELRLAA